MKETYICDGIRFKTYDEVLTYCEKNYFKIVNTQTLHKGVYLITVKGIEYSKQVKSII